VIPIEEIESDDEKAELQPEHKMIKMQPQTKFRGEEDAYSTTSSRKGVRK